MHDLATATATPPLDTAERAWRATASQAIHPSVERRPMPLVEAIAAGLAAATAPWAPIAAAPDRRSYERLLSTEQYDAWLIHWPVGTAVDVHDHGGSAGAFAVVVGTLDEARIDVSGVTTRRSVGPGGSASFGTTDIHAVANNGPVAVTSVHVYAPPLRAMGFYRVEGGDVVPDRTDAI